MSAITIQRCAVCGRPPEAQTGTTGALVLYETADGGEAWMHRRCAEREKA